MVGKLGIGGDPVNRYDGYMSEALRIRSLELLGGHPALDFVNTLDWRDRAPEDGGAEECIVSFQALLAWVQRAGLVTAAEATALAIAAERDPRAASAAAREAVVLREAIHDLVIAARSGRQPPPAQLERVNHWLARAPATARLSATADGFIWASQLPAAEPAILLSRLALTAGELLASGQLRRVGCCAGHGCGWLYLDSSPNRRRRWCSMEGCGNRAKAKRHYQRTKTTG